jgi:hypothetical protein
MMLNQLPTRKNQAQIKAEREAELKACCANRMARMAVAVAKGREQGLATAQRIRQAAAAVGLKPAAKPQRRRARR